MTADQAARAHSLAKRILEEVGIEVPAGRIQERLKAKGFRTKGNRVLFDPAIVEEHVDKMRTWIASQPPPSTMGDDQMFVAFPPTQFQELDDGRLSLCVSPASQYVHDLETDRVVPYTIDRLIQMCKLVDSLADDRVLGAPPGTPPEVHPDLQPLAQYCIAALYARQRVRLVYPISIKTAGHLFEIAEVMGTPFNTLPVFMTSPLRLADESLDVVLAYSDRVSHIWIGNMPLTGATAPAFPFGALAQAAAELMAGLVIVGSLTNKPAVFRVGIFPFDLRAVAVVFGTPESMLFQLLCRDFNQYYGWPRILAPQNIHVMSKLPDSQCAAERSAIMTLGAFLGARYFECAGVLGLDEVFSPAQLLIDCEMRDWVQRAVCGLDLGEEGVNDWLLEITKGLDHGFLALGSTMDSYKQGDVWFPQRFQRGATGPWLSKGQPRIGERLREEVKERIATHNYELDADRRREIERIYRSAQQAVNLEAASQSNLDFGRVRR
jgi:trimethylamine--corrinoid protein Co-methyltransferase